MFENPDGTSTDFESFRASRRRFLDMLAADSLLTQSERGSFVPAAEPEEEIVEARVVVEGDLVVLVDERRLVLGYFSSGQTDLADVVRAGLGLRDEAFGVGRVGPVRITVERVPAGPDPRTHR